MRVLVVPDKFKGTLSAEAAARAIAQGWARARPRDLLELLPMSDGGDGFGPVIGSLLGARRRHVATVDAAHRPCHARWWWVDATRTAVLETAQSNGLARLPLGEFHPFSLDTHGVGRLVEAARKAGARTCILGVGGSATNDGGFGLARAVGWRFLDRSGRELDRWVDLERVCELVPPAPSRKPCSFQVATNVSNPLLGQRGASRIYGPQKGLRGKDIDRAEACLRRLAWIVRRDLGFDQRLPGSGAGGGLGFGLQAFFGASRRLGFDLFAELANLDGRLRRSDLVITGEGSVDASSRMGKGVGQLLARCCSHSKPVAILGGCVDPGTRRANSVVAVGSLVELVGREAAMAHPAASLSRLGMKMALEFQA